MQAARNNTQQHPQPDLKRVLEQVNADDYLV
jgi:hypothetical protein